MRGRLRHPRSRADSDTSSKSEEKKGDPDADTEAEPLRSLTIELHDEFPDGSAVPIFLAARRLILYYY